MKKLGLALCLSLVGLAPAHAQQMTGQPTQAGVGGAYNSSAPTCVSGFPCWLQVDVNGQLKVVGTFTPSGSSPEFTPVAPAAATATKGVLAGCQYDSTQKTLTDGQQAAVSCTNRGAFIVATGADGFAVTNAGTFATQSAITAASGAIASGALAAGAMVDLVALSAPVAPATATATKSMLLGAQATTAAVNPSTGQQGALSSDTNNNLLVSAGGAPNLSISQVSIATSDTLAIAARALRRSVTIQQITGTQNVFCNQTTATAANGVVLPAVVGASVTLNTTSAVRCIAITGAQTVAIAETF
jgi:hypothetical protein